MSSDRFARARLLLEQNRHDLARREVMARLAEQPDDPDGFILLALCQNALDDPAAHDTARRAVELAPDDSRSHFVLSLVELRRHDYAAAEDAVRRAIGLNSWNAGYFGHLAACHIAQSEWGEALAAADEGLAIDPDDDVCLNNRAVALTKLGRHDDAATTLKGTLEKHPEDSFTHANRGWSLLHENDPHQAAVHFREALRLDPNSAWAKEGLLEALRAKSWFYRRVLQVFLWLGRFPPRVRFGLMIGVLLVIHVLAEVSKELPPAGQLLLLLGALAYLLFAGAMWFASHLSNVVLSLSRDGRMLLNRSKIAVSVVVTALAAVAFGCGVMGFAGGDEWYLPWFMLSLFTAVHIASVVTIPAGRHFRIGAVASTVIVLFAVWNVALALRTLTELDELRQQAEALDQKTAGLKELPPPLRADQFRFQMRLQSFRDRSRSAIQQQNILNYACLGVLLLHVYLKAKAIRTPVVRLG